MRRRYKEYYRNLFENRRVLSNNVDGIGLTLFMYIGKLIQWNDTINRIKTITNQIISRREE